MKYRVVQAQATRVVLVFWLWASPLAVARGQEAQGKIQVTEEPGLMFDPKTKLHEWERENVTPLFSEGAKTKEDLGKLVRHERFPRGMASITLGPAAVAEARDYVARGLRGEVPLETVTFKPRRERALFIQMAFGSKGNPDKIRVWDLVLWAGDRDLVAWAIPLQSANMRLLIPISCGNLAREPFRLQAEVNEECTGPW